MRKILFLDIDGVVNHHETFKKGELWPLDPYCAFLVGKIQLDTGCEVILSSSWRHHPDGVAECSKRIVPILDITPDLRDTRIRGAEIHAWLSKNVKGFNSTYKGDFRIAILDDDSDMLLWQKEHFFQTDFMKGGLTDEIAARVIAHLNGTTEPVSTEH